MKNNKISDLKYYIKDLVIDYKIGDIEKNNLDTLINEIRDKNKANAYISENLLSYLKESVQKIQYAYNQPIKENKYKEDNIPTYEIKKFTKKDIKKWANSEHSKENINKKEFLIEMLAITDIVNELICYHRMREVQIILILIILNSEENRGLFGQIKTGEGKSTIVSTLAVIKALQLKHVDVLSSSIVLAKRDTEKKIILQSF